MASHENSDLVHSKLSITGRNLGHWDILTILKASHIISVSLKILGCWNYSVWVRLCKQSGTLYILDDFPLRLERVLELNSQIKIIKCTCQVAEAQACQIQAPSTYCSTPSSKFSTRKGGRPTPLIRPLKRTIHTSHVHQFLWCYLQ